jgi:hypothetical protein
MKKNGTIIIFVILIVVSISMNAQKSGATIIRIEDGSNSKCINQNEHAVQIGLAAIKLSKTKNWFKNQTQAGIQVGIRISGRDSQFNTKATELTQMYMVNVKDYNKGSILLPMEGSIVDFFPLRNNGAFYSGIDLSVSLLEKKGNTPFGTVIKELANFTKQYPLPTNPFNNTVKKLANFTTDLISRNNDDGNNVKRHDVPNSTINLPFSPDSDCTGNLFQEKTGVFAIVYGNKDTKEAGHIDINKTAQYIFKIQKEPSRTILVAKKDNNGKTTKYTPIQNEFIMFYINAFSIVPTKNKAVSEVTFQKTPLWVDRSEVIEAVSGSKWYQFSSNNFRQDFKSNLSFQDAKHFNPNKSINDTELVESQPTLNYTIISDYIEASKRLLSLGLEKQIIQLPNLPVFLQEKK